MVSAKILYQFLIAPCGAQIISLFRLSLNALIY